MEEFTCHLCQIQCVGKMCAFKEEFRIVDGIHGSHMDEINVAFGQYIPLNKWGQPILGEFINFIR
jgi:hypothetical protein